MKPLLLITLLSLASWTACNGQIFEGKVVYRLSIESSDPKRLSSEQIAMMFNDVDTTCILYLKGDQYKFVTLDRETSEVKVVNQYDPVSNKIYDYVVTDETAKPFIMQSENFGVLNAFKRKKTGSEKTKILGESCEGLILDYGTHSTTLYFSNKKKVNSSAIRKDGPAFLQYFRECESIPLKIIMSGGGAVHNLIFEVVEIVEGPVDENVFVLPK